MCDVVSAAYLAIAAVGAGVQAKNQRDAAEATNENIANNYKVKNGQMYQQQLQEGRQYADQQNQLAEQARAQRASILTIGGENGAAGNFIQRALVESGISENYTASKLQMNQDNYLMSTAQQQDAMKMQGDAAMQAKTSYSTVLLGTALKGAQMAVAKYGPEYFPTERPTAPGGTVFGGSPASTQGSYFGASHSNLQDMGLLNENISRLPWRN